MMNRNNIKWFGINNRRKYLLSKEVKLNNYLRN